MANTKMFGLKGVASEVQMGKGGGKLSWSTDHFDTKNSSGAYANVRVALDPVNAHDATSKQYVDGLVQGLDVKASCRAMATSAPGTPSVSPVNSWTSIASPFVVDGVTMADGDRVLVNISGGDAGNGIFVYTAGTNSLARSEDANDLNDSSDTKPEVSAGMFTFIEEGTANADCGYVLVTNNTITLGVTPLSFTKFSNAGTFHAGNSIVFGGTDGLRIDVHANTSQMTTTGGGDNKTLTIVGDAQHKVLMVPATASDPAAWSYVQDLYDASGNKTFEVNSASNSEHLVLTTASASGSAGIVEVATTNSAQLKINTGSGAMTIVNGGTTVSSTGATNISDKGFTVSSVGSTNITNTTGTNLSSGGATNIKDAGFTVTSTGSTNISNTTGTTIASGNTNTFTSANDTTISAGGGVNINSGSKDIVINSAGHEVVVLGESFDVTVTGKASIAAATGLDVTSPGYVSIATPTLTASTATTTFTATTAFNVVGGKVDIKGTDTNISSSGSVTITSTGGDMNINTGSNELVVTGHSFDVTVTNITENATGTITENAATINENASTINLTATGNMTIKDANFSVSSSGTTSIVDNGGTTISSGGATNITNTATNITSTGDVTIKDRNTVISSSGSVTITSTGGDMNIDTGTNELVIKGHSFDVTVTDINENANNINVTATNNLVIKDANLSVSSSGTTTILDNGGTTLSSGGNTTITNTGTTVSSSGAVTIRDTSTDISSSGTTTIRDTGTTISSSGATNITNTATNITSTGDVVINDRNTVISSSGTVSITSTGGDMKIDTGTNELVIVGHSLDVTVAGGVNINAGTTINITTPSDLNVTNNNFYMTSTGAVNITNTSTIINSTGPVDINATTVYVTATGGIALDPGTGYVTTTTTNFSGAPSNALTTISYVDNLISQHADHIMSLGFDTLAGGAGIFTQAFTLGSGNTKGDNGQIDFYASESSSGSAKKVVVIKSGATVANGEYTTLANKSTGSGTGEVRIEAHNTGDTGDCDIRLVPLGNGQVFIGETGDGVIQADDNHALTVMGGNANGGTAGNLVLSGGLGVDSFKSGDVIIRGGLTGGTAGGANGKVKIEDAYSRTVAEIETVLASSVTSYQYFTLQNAGSASTVGPVLSVDGSDTTIDMTLQPKGSGLVLVPSAYTSLLDGAPQNALVDKGWVQTQITGGVTGLIATQVDHFTFANDSGNALTIGGLAAVLPQYARLMRVRIIVDTTFTTSDGCVIAVGSTNVVTADMVDLTDAAGTIYEIDTNYLETLAAGEAITLTVNSTGGAGAGTVVCEYRTGSVSSN